MGKRYSKTTRWIKRYTLNPKDAQEIIRKEFSDSRGNKMNLILDVTPQKPKAPIIEWNREYKE